MTRKSITNEAEMSIEGEPSQYQAVSALPKPDGLWNYYYSPVGCKHCPQNVQTNLRT